jgi:hypothetical protein
MEQHFNYDSLMEYCKEKFSDIKPKQVPEDISELVPEAVWNTMTKDKKRIFRKHLVVIPVNSGQQLY